MFSRHHSLRVSKAGRSSGFALVLVIWCLGLFALIAISVPGVVRERARTTTNVIENARAEALADGAIHIAIANLFNYLYVLETRGGSWVKLDGSTHVCRLTEGAVARIAVQDEGGKVDLNAATEELLVRLLAGFGLDEDEAEVMATRIADYRDADNMERWRGAEAPSYRIAGKTHGPKNAIFETVSELQQVLGMSDHLYRKVEPYVTVHNGWYGVDPGVAANALKIALSGYVPPLSAEGWLIDYSSGWSGSPQIPGLFIAESKHKAFSIRAEVITVTGARFVRDAVVQMISSFTGEYRIKSWSRGTKEAGETQTFSEGILPSC